MGQGIIDNEKLVELLYKADYKGFLATEMDQPHSDWKNREDEAVELSVHELRRIAGKFVN